MKLVVILNYRMTHDALLLLLNLGVVVLGMPPPRLYSQRHQLDALVHQPLYEADPFLQFFPSVAQLYPSSVLCLVSSDRPIFLQTFVFISDLNL